MADPRPIGLHTGSPLLPTRATWAGRASRGAYRGGRTRWPGSAFASHRGRRSTSMAVTDLGDHGSRISTSPSGIFQLGAEPISTPQDDLQYQPAPAGELVRRPPARDRGDLESDCNPRPASSPSPAGRTGKTRLAIEAAASLVPDFKAGVFWVDLAPAARSRPRPTASADVTTPRRASLHIIGEREMLLVLDNLEQVVEQRPSSRPCRARAPNCAVLDTAASGCGSAAKSTHRRPPLGRREAGELFSERSGMTRSDEMDELCAALGRPSARDRARRRRGRAS